MKQFVIAFFALASFNAFSADFTCRYLWNLEELYQNTFSIADGAKNIKIAEVEQYTFFITSLSDNKYELQALDNNLPARTYAVARVSAESPELGLVIWNREHIMEVSCSLK